VGLFVIFPASPAGQLAPSHNPMTLITRISLLAVLAAAPLAAQEPAAAAACPVDLNQPKELITPYNITRMRALQLAPGDERGKTIRDIMKVLGNPKVSSRNQQGVDLFAGQMLILWMAQPDVGETTQS